MFNTVVTFPAKRSTSIRTSKPIPPSADAIAALRATEAGLPVPADVRDRLNRTIRRRLLKIYGNVDFTISPATPNGRADID